MASAKPTNGKPKTKPKPKPAPKPQKREQTSLRALADQTDALARPRITVPDANSDVDGDAALAVKGQVNILGATYVLELFDGETLVGSSKADPDESGMVLFTVSADLLEAGKTYTLRLLMSPDDGTTPPNLDHEITITTGGLQTAPGTPPPPLIE